jgi:hypothetical protein
MKRYEDALACRESREANPPLPFRGFILAIKRAIEMAADTNPLAWSAEPNTQCARPQHQLLALVIWSG